jgi:hypothetical protein
MPKGPELFSSSFPYLEAVVGHASAGTIARARDASRVSPVEARNSSVVLCQSSVCLQKIRGCDFTDESRLQRGGYILSAFVPEESCSQA